MERASDDAPRLILQQLANGKLLREACYLVGRELNLNSGALKENFRQRRLRQGYRTVYAMLADYVQQGIVLVDRKPAF